MGPHELLKRRARLTQGKGPARVRDRGLDLAAMPDDADIAEQPLDIPCTEAGNGLRVEICECFPKVLAFTQNRQPGQA